MSTSPDFNLINPEALTAGKLRSAEEENLFVAVRDQHHDDEVPFVVCSVNGVRVLVALHWDKPFEVREVQRWPERAGYAVRSFVVEVDRSHVQRRFDEKDCKPGEVICHDGGVGLIAIDETGTQYLVNLGGGKLESGQSSVLIAFGRWELVRGEKNERQVLYHYTGNRLLFGAFDPDTDEGL